MEFNGTWSYIFKSAVKQENYPIEKLYYKKYL